LIEKIKKQINSDKHEAVCVCRTHITNNANAPWQWSWISQSKQQICHKNSHSKIKYTLRSNINYRYVLWCIDSSICATYPCPTHIWYFM